MATQRERADAERDSAEDAWKAVVELQREAARLRSELEDATAAVESAARKAHTYWSHSDGNVRAPEDHSDHGFENCHGKECSGWLATLARLRAETQDETKQ